MRNLSRGILALAALAATGAGAAPSVVRVEGGPGAQTLVEGQGMPRVRVVLPGGGVYRLFCFVFDKSPDGRRKSAATACRPLLGTE